MALPVTRTPISEYLKVSIKKKQSSLAITPSMMHASLTRYFCVTWFKIVALDPVFHGANLMVGTRDFELILQFSFLFFFYHGRCTGKEFKS